MSGPVIPGGGGLPARLGHLSFEVADLARTTWFYDRFLRRLGFERFVAEASYAGYRTSDLTIWFLHETPERVRRRAITGEENVVAEHLAFFVRSAGEVARVQADLEKVEIYPTFRATEHPEFHAGYFSATWVDPDQIVLEVYTIPEGSARSRTPAHTSAKKARPQLRTVPRPQPKKKKKVPRAR
jgi:catechol 2,3-dioxygenase-like lactoylglutathione lyase family enzyme